MVFIYSVVWFQSNDSVSCHRDGNKASKQKLYSEYLICVGVTTYSRTGISIGPDYELANKIVLQILLAG